MIQQWTTIIKCYSPILPSVHTAITAEVPQVTAATDCATFMLNGVKACQTASNGDAAQVCVQL